MANRFSYRAFRQSPQEWTEWVDFVSAALHSDTKFRLPLVLLGMLLARGRRTVSTWLRAAGLSDDYEDYYYFISSLGRKADAVAARLLALLAKHLPASDRIVLALDDTPTSRYGPEVEGAGLHHNPTSGPDDHKFIYGHVWVTLAWVVRHPRWSTIGLPLLARLYVKAKDLPKLVAKRGDWEFRTKLQLAAELVEWAVKRLAFLGIPIWIVTDGAYAYRSLLRRILPLGVIFVSRLRRDAGLRSVPPPRKPGQRGGRRKYGTQKFSLAKRAAHRRGWEQVEVTVYGQTVIKTCKTFLATWPVVGGVIRIVILREPHGWEAFFCTDPQASVRQIVECFSDRGAIEQVFHDVKEVWGSGQQQVRNVWSNIGCFNLNLWMHTLVELWAWNRSGDELRDRRLSPWDSADRRPSHADRRKALRLECLDREFRSLDKHDKIPRRIKQLFQSLALLAA
jgi:hypothetical protein